MNKSKLSSLIKFIHNLPVVDFLPDKIYLKLAFRIRHGRKLSLKTPKTFSEKLQWLKLYNRKPEQTIMVDKYAVRDFVAEKIGSEYLIPLLGVWDSPDDIEFDSLPEQFVLKCNHTSGAGLHICTDKSTLDKEAVKEDLKTAMNKDYYLTNREWPYKNVPRKIIAEKYMIDVSTNDLRDYKFFTFDGEPKFLFVASERHKEGSETKFDFFDMNYNHMDFTNGHPNAAELPQKPECFEEMISLARKLSEGTPHLRVDFYEIDGKVYFGELTFFHWSGMIPFNPVEWDYKLGEMLHLPARKSV